MRLGFIGAGNYATSMLLPHLRDNSGVELVSVATTKSLSGLNAQRKFGFATITTSVESVLDDDTLDAVFIVTRHHSHAGLVCQALERGLTVFVEKPLALTDEQLAAVLDTVERTGNDRVMVGFNRRFAPLFTDLQERFGASRGPVSARYLINAGRLDASSWYLNEELEGSRFAGEGGHFIDTLSALVGHHPVEAYAMADGASVHTTLRFADGSVATISYVTDGSSRFPKETLDVVGDGRNGRLDNFQRVTVWSAKGKSGHRVLAGQDKGQRAAARALRRRRPHGIPDADPAGLPGRDDPRDARRRNQPVVRKAGCLVSRPSAGWYIRRLRGMSLTEVVYRTLDAGRRRTWARRQVRPGEAVRTADGRPAGPRLQLAAADVGSRRRGSGSSVRTARGCRHGPGRNVDRAGYAVAPTARTRTGSMIR